MDFEEFKEQIAKDLKEVLYSRYGMDASVEQRTVEKLNSAYDALTVKPEDCEIGVSMNLDTLYDAYRNGEAYDVVLNKAAELADGSLRNKPEFNFENIMNYDVMKETLVMEVVSADRNADFLKNIPHKNIEDLAVVYRFQVCGMEDGHGTILVTNDLLRGDDEMYKRFPERFVRKDNNGEEWVSLYLYQEIKKEVPGIKEFSPYLPRGEQHI